MANNGGDKGACLFPSKHKLYCDILSETSLPKCTLRFPVVRDPSTMAKFNNFMRADSSGYPMNEFVNALNFSGLLDNEGVEEVSRFCVINGDLISHYEHVPTMPSSATSQELQTALAAYV